MTLSPDGMERTAESDLFFASHGRGFPLLAIHAGLGWDHSYLRPALNPLGDHAEVIYFDVRGNGRSPEPEDWEAVSHETWIRDAETLRRRLRHEKVLVFGHSYGGFLAQDQPFSLDG